MISNVIYIAAASILGGLINLFQLYMNNKNEILDIESWHKED